MTPITAPMLPSPRLREYYARAVAERVANIKSELRDLILDGLGDLALFFAQRPLRHWHGSRDVLARALGERWAWPEATAIIELSAQAGLLVPTRLALSNGPDADPLFDLRPVDVGTFTWLGARRIARTEDQDGLMDFRLNGSLFDMFAMTPSFVNDVEGQAGLVRLMSDRPGPYDDLLELGTALAAAAVAWGAEADPELRLFLTERSLTWTQPMGADWNRETATALLVLESQRNEEREHLMNLASEALVEIVQSALSDVDLQNNPAILATLDTQLAVLLAGSRPTGGASEDFRPPARERVEQIMRSLPAQHAHRVPKGLGRVLPPGADRNRLLVASAQMALELGDPLGVVGLEALVEPYDDASEVMVAVLVSAEQSPRETAPTRAAIEACAVLRTWDRCPAVILTHLGSLLANAEVPELRVSVAAALGQHGVSADPERSSTTVQAAVATFIDELGSGNPEVMTGAVGALLHLGARDTRLAPTALALCSGQITPRLASLLGSAMDDGLRRVPGHMDALVELFFEFPERPEVMTAMLALCAAITDTIQIEYELGPFSPSIPLEPAKLSLLLTALLPIASDLEQPQISAEAATACAALLRGDHGFVLTLVNLRSYAEDPTLKSLYDLALGASRVFEPSVVERLARDAVQADSDVAAAACVALRLLVETFGQAHALEQWLPEIRSRLEQLGPHQVPMLHLLVQLATAPLGPDSA